MERRIIIIIIGVNMETQNEKKEKLFEKPVLIILIIISAITLALLSEAMINNSKANAVRKNVYELNNAK